MGLLDRLRPRPAVFEGGAIYPTPNTGFLDELNFPLTEELAAFLGLKDSSKDQNGNPYNVLTVEWGYVILTSESESKDGGIATHGFYRAVPSREIADLHEILRVMKSLYYAGTSHAFKQLRSHARQVLAEAIERI